jgi:hypothetical protein
MEREAANFSAKTPTLSGWLSGPPRDAFGLRC